MGIIIKRVTRVTTEVMKFLQACTLGLMATAASAQEISGTEE